MHIVVLIKQVPSISDINVNPQTNTLIREGVESITNPFDLFAIEEAVRLKENKGGRVTAISMGPPQAEAVLREAIALGADEGILLTDQAFAGSDTWTTSYILSLAIRKLGPVDVIICGRQASDGDTGQVGPGIAAQLDIPQITYVRKIEQCTESHIIAERLLERGYESIEASLPCLLTVVKEINEPRLPSLKGKLAARRTAISIWNAKDIGGEPDCFGLIGSPTQVIKMFPPERHQKGEILIGDPHVISCTLVQKLYDIVVHRI